MGQKPTEEELFQMISEVDDNMTGAIDFGGVYFDSPCGVDEGTRTCVIAGEFLKVIEKQKERAAQFDDESDMSTFRANARITRAPSNYPTWRPSCSRCFCCLWWQC